MTVLKAILCIMFTSFAVHYGWKMRGTVVGGEKGAMVPGLFAGLSLALFAGGGIREYFWIPAAAGLIGMTYGGIEPYGDNIALIEDHGYDVEPNRLKGLGGLALKGALWFSIAGGYIGLALSAMGGKYSVAEIAVFPILVIVLQSIGYGVFNTPYKPEENKYPRIYLTFESRDEWGSNIGVLLAILIYAVMKKNALPAVIAGCGFVFGAVGWLVAMRLYRYTNSPMKNGKYLFGKLGKNHIVGGWGNMEYCLGTFGGAGIALGFVLCRNYIDTINLSIKNNGIFAPVNGKENLSVAVIVFTFAALLAVNIYEYICDRKDKKYNGFIMDVIERPFFNTIPFTLVLLCSLPAAKLMTAFMAIYALCIKNWFDRLKPGRGRILVIICSSALCIAVFVLTLITNGPTPTWIWISGGIPYVIAEIIWSTMGENKSIKRLLKLDGFTFNVILLTVQSTIVAVIGSII